MGPLSPLSRFLCLSYITPPATWCHEDCQNLNRLQGTGGKSRQGHLPRLSMGHHLAPNLESVHFPACTQTQLRPLYSAPPTSPVVGPGAALFDVLTSLVLYCWELSSWLCQCHGTIFFDLWEVLATVTLSMLLWGELLCHSGWQEAPSGCIPETSVPLGLQAQPPRPASEDNLKSLPLTKDGTNHISITMRIATDCQLVIYYCTTNNSRALLKGNTFIVSHSFWESGTQEQLTWWFCLKVSNDTAVRLWAGDTLIWIWVWKICFQTPLCSFWQETSVPHDVCFFMWLFITRLPPEWV